jgi:uncharacterized protein YdaU (DUF1376 family)
MKKIKYVQLEADAFLTDIDFVMMDAQQRGVYVTILLFLYSNAGKCELDSATLKRICNCENFEKIWESIKKKFQIKNNIIRHKRVTYELKRAKRLSQAQRAKGLKGAQKRWQGDGTANGAANVTTMANEGKGKEIEIEDNNYSNSKERSFSASSSLQIQALHFNTALQSIIRPASVSDRTCFKNVTYWLVEQCARGKFTNQIFNRVLDYAKESKKAKNPAAAFMAALKNELEYNTKRKI